MNIPRKESIVWKFSRSWWYVLPQSLATRSNVHPGSDATTINALAVEICNMDDVISHPVSSPAAHRCFIAQHLFAAWIAFISSQCKPLCGSEVAIKCSGQHEPTRLLARKIASLGTRYSLLREPSCVTSLGIVRSPYPERFNSRVAPFCSRREILKLCRVILIRLDINSIFANRDDFQANHSRLALIASHVDDDPTGQQFEHFFSSRAG
jgi:hypothetical protein